MVYLKRISSVSKSKLPNGVPSMNLNCTAVTLDEAWSFWYNKIAKMAADGTDDSRDGAVVGEIINATTVILDPTQNIMKSEIRKLPMRYMIGELLWYLSGDPTLKAIQNYTDAWDRMSDDGVFVNSNYGHIIQHCNNAHGGTFNQYEYVKRLLVKDPNSRQAIIHIKTPRDTTIHPTKDLNCTIALQFFIRDNALHCTTYMRSNDLWMGFPNDIFQFTCIQIRMAMELGVDIGYYTHIAGSLHLYERDYKKSLENFSKSTNCVIDGVSAITTGRMSCDKPHEAARPKSEESPEEFVGQDSGSDLPYENNPDYPWIPS